MKFSLIIPTLNRALELESLLLSIKKSSYSNYEIIIVDQSEEGYLENLVNKDSSEFKEFKYFRVKFKGAAKARNFGIKYSTGEVINFPDDDSEYTSDLLEKTHKYFASNKVDAVFGVTIDKSTGEFSCLKFLDKESDVTKDNMFRTTIEATMFVKRSVFNVVGGYDETLGVGTKYGADEGADLVLRLLYDKYNLKFSPELIFYHPNKESAKNSNVIVRGYTYGMGFGRLAAKHKFIYNYNKIYDRYLLSIFKGIIKMIIAILKFDMFNLKYNKNIIKGRIRGYRESKIEYKRVIKNES